jgi:hypothetical protein
MTICSSGRLAAVTLLALGTSACGGGGDGIAEPAFVDTSTLATLAPVASCATLAGNEIPASAGKRGRDQRHAGPA